MAIRILAAQLGQSGDPVQITDTWSWQVEVGLVDALKLVARMRTISLKSIIGTEALLKQHLQQQMELAWRSDANHDQS